MFLFVDQCFNIYGMKCSLEIMDFTKWQTGYAGYAGYATN